VPASSGTKIFGLRVGVDPKILAGGLIALAVVLYWFNSRSDTDPVPVSVPVVRPNASIASAPAVRRRTAATRRPRNSNNDAGELQLRPIDPTRGDVDPTLRLDLLARLQNVQPAGAGRSLFEIGPAPLSAEDQKLLAHPPAIPKPTMPSTAVQAGPIDPPLNIPLKYYGFMKPGEQSQGNQGLFLDGDNVVVGSEGATVMKRYLIVSLTPTAARLEDTELKKGQTLPVVPLATP
jgi:hypothetical protein